MTVYKATQWLPTGGHELANVVIVDDRGAWLGQVWDDGCFPLVGTVEYFEDGRWHDEFLPVPAEPGWEQDVDGVITCWQNHLWPEHPQGA